MLPVLLTTIVKLTLVLGEPKAGIGGLGDHDACFLSPHISRGAVGHVLAVFRFALYVHTVGQSLDAVDWSVDVGYDPKQLSLLRKSWDRYRSN